MKWSVGVMPLCVLLAAMPAFGAAPIIRSAVQISPQSEVSRAAPLSVEARLQLVERRMQALTDILMRLDRIQQEVQQLRGEVELQGHGLESLKKRQRDLYSDIDRRLTTNQLPASSYTPTAVPPVPTVPPLTSPPGAASPQAVTPVVNQDVPVKEISEPLSTAAASVVSSAPVAGGILENVPVAEASPGAATVAPSVAVPVADPALEQPMYKQAFDLLMQRRYEEAKQSFRLFLQQYPNGRLAANAQYWVGEASYVTRDFATARDEFTKVVQNFPGSTKVSDSLLKIAFIQYEHKEWAEARKTLESIVEQYASSTAARLALKRLDRMRIEGN